MRRYFNLGRHSQPITTRSPEAQLWFDRGLNWSYALHREEAASIERQLAAAQAVTDIAVSSSCFCRQTDSCCDLS